VFGIDKGWKEINLNAEIKIPKFFKFVMKYITPLFLLAVFVGSFISPLNGDWKSAIAQLSAGKGWPLDPGSIIGKLLKIGIEDTRYFIDGMPTSVFIIDMTRLLLLMTFLAIGLMVWYVWKRKLSTNEKGP